MRILLTAAALGGLPGSTVAEALARGWREVNADAMIDASGSSDGDRGLLDAVEAARGGSREVVTVLRGDAPDPRAPEPVPVVVLLAAGSAYVETRDVLGVAGSAPEAERTTTAREGSSFGVGQVVLAAIERGARRVVLGSGTPAALDAGTGVLRALAGREPAPFDPGEAEADLADVLTAARSRCAGVELVLLAPEPVPARGLRGAASRLTDALGAVESQELDARLTALVRRYAELLPRRRYLLGAVGTGTADAAAPQASLSGPPGSGSGGGLGLAVLALGGRVEAGPAFLAAECGLAGRAEGADLVVVLADELDPVEADRGVTAAVAAAAATHGVAVLTLARRVRLERRTAASAGISATATLAPSVAGEPAATARARAAVDLDADAVAALAHRHARAWRW